MSERLPALDALRAVGSIAVVATHVGFLTGFTFQDSIWGGVVARLDSGVAIFFALSGFLLFRPFAASVAAGDGKRQFGRYLLRRAVRILPAYWLMVIVVLLVLPQNKHTTSAVLWHYLTLTQIYSPGYGFITGLTQVWSLATEASFYVLLPFIVIVTLGRRWHPVRTVIVIGAISFVANAIWLEWRAVGFINADPTSNWLPMYAFWFGTGMVLATIHVAVRTGTGPRSWRFLDDLGASPLACWGIAFALLVMTSTSIAGPRDIQPVTIGELSTKQFLYAIIAALLLIPAAFGPQDRFKAVLSSSPVRWLGTVSYGVFLWHLFVLEEIYLYEQQPYLTGDLLTTFLGCLAGSLLLASLSYYLLERPLLQLTASKRRRLQNHGQPEHANRQQPSDLWPESRVLVVPPGQRQVPAQGQQPDRDPQFYRT
jgi:peptidoglycan/LPS O-acetylase OafA/YrhL